MTPSSISLLLKNAGLLIIQSPVPVVNLIRLACSGESDDVGSDERLLQAHWLDGHRPVSVAGNARGRDLYLAPADGRSATSGSKATELRHIVDRLIFVGLCRLFPTMSDALAIVKPGTIVRWHRAGFRSYWRWKSRRRVGRPNVPAEIRRLIREMPTRCGERHGFMASFSSSALRWGKLAWPSTWPDGEARHPRAGRHSFAIMPTASLRWTCSWCRQFRFACSMAC